MGGQVQHGWASVSVNVFLRVEVVSKYDSSEAFTSVIVLVQNVAVFSGGVQTSPQEWKKHGKWAL